MARSMTGFGRGKVQEEGKLCSVEIRTVNHRYSDISIKMPRQVSFLEEKVRDVVSKALSRGKADIFIAYENYGDDRKDVLVNKALARAYIEAAGTLRDKFGLMDDITVSIVARFPDVIKVQDAEENEDDVWNFVKKALDMAIENLVKMREEEGRKLEGDILSKTEYIEDRLKQIETRAPGVIKEYRIKLENRIKELTEQKLADENRISMEVALFADRCSIDEEIVRLKSHIEQVRETIRSKEPVGRKLDFLVQEMIREANTIGSKANDLAIVKEILEIKCEVEKMREQIQNIE
ncbi:MAG: YicC family protein [Clostridiaceae bacterium]|nr:YicC family protein [Clostridiaceae bacterium]